MALGMSQATEDSSGWRGTNEGSKMFGASGFAALLGGYRVNSDAVFVYFGYSGIWWSSSAVDSSYAMYRLIAYNYANVNRGVSNKHNGFTVRCIMD
jgi:uncharacterized protein (TIGR02145 family)